MLTMICKECNKEIVGSIQKRFCSDSCRKRFSRKNSDKENSDKVEKSDKIKEVGHSNKSIFAGELGLSDKAYYLNKLNAAIARDDPFMIEHYNNKLNDC